MTLTSAKEIETVFWRGTLWN